MKKCNICQLEKPESHFYQQDGKPMYCCKICYQDIVAIRNWKKNDKDPDFDKNRQRWDIRRIWNHRYIGIKQRALGRNGWNVNATGKGLISRKDFDEWCINSIDDFLKIWARWVKSDFKKSLAPSIDRIDNNKGYIKGNLQWLSKSDNIKKFHSEISTRKGAIMAIKDGRLIETFRSQKEACDALNLSQPKVSLVLNGKRKTTGGYQLVYEK